GTAALRLLVQRRNPDLPTSAALPLAFVLAAEQAMFFLGSSPQDLMWWTANILGGLAALLLIGAILETAAESGRLQANRPGTGGQLAAGLVVAGYEILGSLGEGGMGQVFKARHLRLNRLVALKVIRPEQVADPNALRRFQREALA